MHENLGSSADWVVTGPSNGLAFLVADSGYDIWLGNNRGNTYSKKHTMFLETSYGFRDFRLFTRRDSVLRYEFNETRI
ncbi:lipase 3-like isoform X3 [Belonocnema kinseyi]|uniref:lipase 3-like isoform X3 n=1 Tax=Belonocnema kinseyi TaxID=2817044 RepID=UPI00143D40D8|nr:lipase 3-like isoform X3 [Belonocnema kinseyi]